MSLSRRLNGKRVMEGSRRRTGRDRRLREAMGVPLWLLTVNSVKWAEKDTRAYLVGLVGNVRRRVHQSCNQAQPRASVLSIMSATSGIAVSPELATIFADAVSSKNVRFLKISIQNGLHYCRSSYKPGSISHLTS